MAGIFSITLPKSRLLGKFPQGFVDVLKIVKMSCYWNSVIRILYSCKFTDVLVS